jgi:hypothetical protein
MHLIFQYVKVIPWRWNKVEHSIYIQNVRMKSIVHRVILDRNSFRKCSILVNGKQMCYIVPAVQCVWRLRIIQKRADTFLLFLNSGQCWAIYRRFTLGLCAISVAVNHRRTIYIYIGKYAILKRILLEFWNTDWIQKKKSNSVVFSPQANYTDWVTATCWRNLVPTFADRGVSRDQRGGSPTVINLSFLDRSRYLSFK